MDASSPVTGRWLRAVTATTVRKMFLLASRSAFCWHSNVNIRLMPERYVNVKQVLESSPVVGKTIEDAGMRHLEKMFLVSVERGADNNHAVCSSCSRFPFCGHKR